MGILDSKVAIIDSAGAVHAMGRVNKSRYHIKYLLDYLEENYPNIDIRKLKIGSSRNYYGYIFSKLGDIIYFNDKGFNGDTGMMFFPDELTDAQIQTLYDLDLGNQKIAICFNFKNVDSYRMVGLEGDSSLPEALDLYMSKTKKRSNFRR